MKTPDSIGVIGAGILGLAIARRIQTRYPGSRVTVVDKEPAVARHQTGNNSGVVHAGIYYPPGSLKARLCRRGADLLREYTAEHGIAYEECGKLVVAVDEGEVEGLRTIQKRGEANGVPGLRWVGPDEIADIEPSAVGRAALHSPATAITDYVAVSEALAADIAAADGQVLLSSEVVAVRPEGEGAVVHLKGGDRLRFDHVVLCAGLQSDRLSATAGDGRAPAIVPFRGEYLKLVPERADIVRGLIYPVPDPRYPFLGVHLTRRVDGSVDVGPNAVFALAREGYGRFDVSPRDLLEAFRYPGFWRVAGQHWRTGIDEMIGSLSMRAFVKKAQVYVPSLEVRDVVRGGAGVRAQAVDPDGALVEDFRIHRMDAITALRNAPSPAATSAFAIAEHVVDELAFG